MPPFRPRSGCVPPLLALHQPRIDAESVRLPPEAERKGSAMPSANAASPELGLTEDEIAELIEAQNVLNAFVASGRYRLKIDEEGHLVLFRMAKDGRWVLVP